jgi:response regulator RpfG family c-di-GMP phosphodiesterase
VKKRILLVQKAQDTQAQVLKAIGSRYDLFAITNAEDALEACRTVGPFAVAVAEHGLPGTSAFDLLRRVNETWPGTVGLLLAPGSDAAAAQRAIEEPHVFRCVATPCTPGQLLSAVDAALSRHVEVEVAEAISEHLQFSKESMEGFTQILEERMERQLAAVEALQRFAMKLIVARSAREIARLAAETTSEILSGRGVQVQLWQATFSGDDVGAGAGGEMSPRLHRTPIATQNAELGEICVDLAGPDGEGLSTIESALVGSIAAASAVAICNEHSRREVDRAQHATILALAKLAEHRDLSTGQHLERVAAFCRLVAEALRALGKGGGAITDAFISDLVCSSPLHDIGKVGIPDSILLKPGRLTPEEWDVMKTHSEVGGSTIDGVIRDFGAPGYLVMGRDIAWAHHEKWDGSGYPRGLQGASIPLSARIVAIADVYDALTTSRPYKKIWSHAEAVDWIASRSGSHFDPDVVAAFLSRVEDADRIRAELADPVPEGSSVAIEIQPP